MSFLLQFEQNINQLAITVEFINFYPALSRKLAKPDFQGQFILSVSLHFESV